MSRGFSDIYCLQHSIEDVPFGVLYSVRRNFDGKNFCARELEYTDTCTSHYRMLKLDVDLLQSFKHPRLVHVFEVIHEKDASTYYVIQEDGTNKHLADMIQAAKVGHPPAEDLVWGYIAQLVDVLAAMHNTSYRLDEEGSLPRVLAHGSLSADIVHTNPSDLRYIKLRTLGVGREVAVGWDLMNMRGSKSYVAPELYYQIAGAYDPSISVDLLLTPECDMWSLGSFIYEICTGNLLIRQKARDYQHSLDDIPRPIPLPGYGAELAKLINSLLSLDPRKRPSAADVLKLSPIQEALSQLNSK